MQCQHTMERLPTLQLPISVPSVCCAALNGPLAQASSHQAFWINNVLRLRSLDSFGPDFEIFERLFKTGEYVAALVN